jgi:hypothetical protein
MSIPTWKNYNNIQYNYLNCIGFSWYFIIKLKEKNVFIFIEQLFMSIPFEKSFASYEKSQFWSNKNVNIKPRDVFLFSSK